MKSPSALLALALALAAAAAGFGNCGCALTPEMVMDASIRKGRFAPADNVDASLLVADGHDISGSRRYRALTSGVAMKVNS